MKHHIDEGPEMPKANEYLRKRLMDAAQDAKEGRIKSCKEVHEALEIQFPWLRE